MDVIGLINQILLTMIKFLNISEKLLNSTFNLFFTLILSFLLALHQLFFHFKFEVLIYLSIYPKVFNQLCFMKYP